MRINLIVTVAILLLCVPCVGYAQDAETPAFQWNIHNVDAQYFDIEERDANGDVVIGEDGKPVIKEQVYVGEIAGITLLENGEVSEETVACFVNQQPPRIDYNIVFFAVLMKDSMPEEAWAPLEERFRQWAAGSNVKKGDALTVDIRYYPDTDRSLFTGDGKVDCLTLTDEETETLKVFGYGKYPDVKICSQYHSLHRTVGWEEEDRQALIQAGTVWIDWLKDGFGCEESMDLPESAGSTLPEQHTVTGTAVSGCYQYRYPRDASRQEIKTLDPVYYRGDCLMLGWDGDPVVCLKEILKRADGLPFRLDIDVSPDTAIEDLRCFSAVDMEGRHNAASFIFQMPSMPGMKEYGESACLLGINGLTRADDAEEFYQRALQWTHVFCGSGCEDQDLGEGAAAIANLYCRPNPAEGNIADR